MSRYTACCLLGDWLCNMRLVCAIDEHQGQVCKVTNNTFSKCMYALKYTFLAGALYISFSQHKAAVL
jgi:hypothetical protein